MAREKSKAPELPADLPDLTPKQMQFVQGLLAGKTATDAYRDAYDVADMATTTIQAEASRLRHNPKVEEWYRAGCIALATSGIISKEDHIRRLEAIGARATAAGDHKTAVAAEHLIGKASGHYTERSEVMHWEPASTLMMLAALSPRGRMIAGDLAALFNLRLPGSQNTLPADDPSLGQPDPSDD